MLVEDAIPGLSLVVHDPALDHGVSRGLVERGEWEPFETKIFQEIARFCRNFLDVGANIGYYTALASCCLKHPRRVLAIEPHPESYKYLLENIRRNALEGVVALNVACMHEDGIYRLLVSPGNFGDARIVASGLDDSDALPVSGRRLDELCAASNFYPDLVKIDAQGAELSIITGMSRLAESGGQPFPLMLLELWPHGLQVQGHEVCELLNLLPKDAQLYCIFEDFQVMLSCNASDLVHWSETILSPEGRRYVNILIVSRQVLQYRKVCTAVSKYVTRAVLVSDTSYQASDGQNLAAYLVPAGWSYPESWGVWSDGAYAIMRFEIDSECEAHELELRLVTLGKQRIHISVGASVLPELTLEAPDPKAIRLPMAGLGDSPSRVREVTLEFFLPDAVPDPNGTDGVDFRVLAIGLLNIRLISNKLQ